MLSINTNLITQPKEQTLYKINIQTETETGIEKEIKLFINYLKEVL